MPLPHDSYKFLGLAYKCLKSHGIIHMYVIEKEKNVKEKIKTIIDKFSKKIKRNISYKINKVLPYAPRTYKYCVDIKIL